MQNLLPENQLVIPWGLWEDSLWSCGLHVRMLLSHSPPQTSGNSSSVRAWQCLVWLGAGGESCCFPTISDHVLPPHLVLYPRLPHTFVSKFPLFMEPYRNFYLRRHNSRYSSTVQTIGLITVPVYFRDIVLIKVPVIIIETFF